ncbi:PIR protein CIR protein [Plasmodium vinckei petteri]|uniref:PIR protein CIR protein n=1 Tax=Plasmodium vinckei petteri TaxID=138298 RepID=A0A6V7TAB9_PLAVN|nr:PIR protein CIR protein [Plasmodium vinckei petteri]
MENQELCKKFLDADKIINDEIEGNLTMSQIINDPEFDKYCPKSKCETNIQRIGALSAYLFMKARVLETTVMENYGQYDEFFLMWLSDKLFNIVKDKPQINDITLNEAYEQHLKNNIVGSNKLDLLDKINGLKEVNLMHMKHFYKLLNPICKVIAYYNPNDDDNNKLIDYSAECYNQYSSLYDSVSECISYLRLLDNLKKTYYSYINYVINENEKKADLAWKLKTLKTSDGEDDYFSKDFNNFDFSDSKCKLEIKLPPESSTTLQALKQSPPVPLPVSQEQDSPPPQKETPLPKPQEGGSDSKNGSNTPDNDKENRGGASGGNVNPDDGSNGPTSSTSGGSLDLWSPFRGFLLNGTEIYNKTLQFIKESQERLNDAKDQISNAYDNAMNNLKSAYNTSSSYFSDIISNIYSQFNQFGTPPKSGNSGNSMPQNNDQSQKNGGSSLPPPKDPSQHSQLPSSPIPTPPSTTSKDPPQNPQQLQPLNPKQQKQSSSQSHHITHKPAQLDPLNHKANTQLVKLPNFNLNLKKPWNLFPTTWNGSGNCKYEIKLMNTTLVCCTSEQCSLTGISVTLVLIPIILSIAYKYLSREWTKKSEKKNMKRVIKLVDGNRKTKIIISSSDRNKDLKPIINSVGRKKNSLLNIYKLMQADPIPFINLFFLLIFFVYKRKSDFLEL